MAIVISRTPSGIVNPGDIVVFSVVSGTSTCLNASFQWYLDNGSGAVLVSDDCTFVLTIPSIGIYNVYVTITEYPNAYWTGGQFYGGSFNGNFFGGTFNYGNLNNCQTIVKQDIKPLPFIQPTQTSSSNNNSNTSSSLLTSQILGTSKTINIKRHN